MKEVLLINPGFSGSLQNPDSYKESIPIGIVYIGSYLDARGYKVRLVDCVTSSGYMDEIKQYLNSADIVGISAMTTQVEEGLKLSDYIKESDPSIPVVWGGAHPTLFPEETCADRAVDYVVWGEGEETFLELTLALEKGESLEKIKGLYFKKDGRSVNTGPRDLLPVDSLPPINWDLLKKDVMQRLILIPSHTSRGCPHRCAFCINCITKYKWRGMKPEKVLDELEVITDLFKNRKIRFWDENFFVNKKRAEAIIDGMIGRGIDVEWETTIRADYFNDRLVNHQFLDKLKRSGCYKLSMGAESGSQKILDLLQKEITVEDIKKSAVMCTEHDILPQYSFMIGLPHETYEDIMKTLDLIDGLLKINPKTEFLGPQPFRPYPGGILYDECVNLGWRGPDTLRSWAEIMKHEWNFLSPRDFPWVSDPDLVEALWPMINYALTDVGKSLNSALVVRNRFLKLAFIIDSRLRWRFKYYRNLYEFKLAKKILGIGR